MTFPAHDSQWQDTATFLKTHLTEEERIVAPPAFNEAFPGQVSSYGALTRKPERFQWMVIHKGLMDQLNYDSLKDVSEGWSPVFANEVFVVFSRRSGLARVPSTSPHILAFRKLLKQQISFKAKLDRWMGKTKADLQFNARRSIPLLSQFSHRVSKVISSPPPAIQSVAASSVPADSTPSSAMASPAAAAPPPDPRMQIYMGDYTALTRTIWGHKMYVDTRDLSLTPHILLDGYWEMWITKFLSQRIRPGMTLVEVGANIGYYTVLNASHIGSGGRLYAFEANPQVFDTLFRNVAVNGLSDRVTLVNKAVSSHTHPIKFSRLKRHQGSSTVLELPEKFAKHYHDEVEVIEVDAISLDDYFIKVNPKVDLIKIDAEGSEGLILKGMKNLIQANPDLEIVFEFAPGSIAGTGEDPGEFLGTFQSYGFQFYKIGTHSGLIPTSKEDLLQTPHCEVFLSRKSNQD